MNENYYSLSRTEMLAFVPINCGKILEVGCGQANFSRKILERQRAEIWGIEPNYDAYLLAKDVCSNVINDFYTKDINIPLNYFDCIIFNDVIEHIVDPWETLEFTKKFLKQDETSCLVASIPNFNYIKNIYQIIFKGDFKYTDSGTLDKTHMRFFTFKSIIRLFEESGYKIEIIKGINPSIHPIFKLINTISFNKLKDMEFLQYAVRARLI